MKQTYPSCMPTQCWWYELLTGSITHDKHNHNPTDWLGYELLTRSITHGKCVMWMLTITNISLCSCSVCIFTWHMRIHKLVVHVVLASSLALHDRICSSLLFIIIAGPVHSENKSGHTHILQMGITWMKMHIPNFIGSIKKTEHSTVILLWKILGRWACLMYSSMTTVRVCPSMTMHGQVPATWPCMHRWN